MTALEHYKACKDMLRLIYQKALVRSDFTDLSTADLVAVRNLLEAKIDTHKPTTPLPPAPTG